ncbi:hypothetical protein [Flavobacterium psychrophilum]|uniref:hypothetical protein n=1 Tax=Flavobacterium psychrophilum TaxID=96345 RepID=UPI001D082982|nr:hypothetical protein [Flavobacterium psychrophilum]MCB6002947.1 hypothetical protein [Flavobacterium psychrophilum]MCB6089557.1 hypothetical protein [Flavobacterium psychrophilum]
MKKILLLFILISNLLSAQSTANLDLKNGFRNFKLGSSPSQIKNIVKKQSQASKNPYVKVYDYFGDDITNIFNVKVESVELSFFKNKLFNISVNFGNIEDSRNFEIYEFNNILSALEQTYGKNWVEPTNKDGVISNGAIWDGKKIRLELMRIDFSKSKTNPKDYGYVQGYINVFDKKMTSEMFSSDF